MKRSGFSRWGWLAAIALATMAMGCPSSKKEPAGAPGPSRKTAEPTPPRADDNAVASAKPPASSAAPTPAPPPPLDLSRYPWHEDDSIDALPVHDDLLRRIDPPEGFARVDNEPGSFGAWLRRLPLASPNTPVRSYGGGTILPPDHRNLAAVVTIDVGKADLQQCADAVMRLFAEWKWSRGERDMRFRAASGTAMPYARWERGQRVVMKGRSIAWVPRAAAAKDDHASFRKYMDAVFAWSNTVALARQADAIDLEALRPGDFMILPGNPGHTVLVLDLARDAEGNRKGLLGQSYMPAQSFHVLRVGPDKVWFDIDPAAGGVKTPFWPKPFPWSSLRRLD